MRARVARGVRVSSVLLAFGASVSSAGCAKVLGADFEGKRLDCPAGALTPPESVPGDLPDLWFALRHLDFGDHGPDGGLGVEGAVGFDVPGAKQCTAPPWAATPEESPSGIDNAYALAYAEFRKQKNVGLPPNGDLASARAEQGDFAELVRIRGYDGTTDDAAVEVAFIDGSMGTRSLTDHPRPEWDGTDEWHGSAAQLSREDGISPAVTAPGTVRGGIVETTVNAARYGLLSRFTFRAALRHGQNGYALADGTIGGVTPISTLFFIAGAFVDAAKSMCVGGAAYSGELGFKAIMCDHVDVDLNGDGVCDSLSAGARFTASPIAMGCPVDYGEQPRCPSDTDPQFDRCGSP